jgi:cobalt/nickel transport protein
MKNLHYIALAIALPIVFITYIIAVGYTPLSDVILELPEETEILLLSLQAGIAAATIGHFLGSRKGEKSKKLSLGKNLKPKQKIDLRAIALVAVVVAIFVLPFVINPGADFEGTDGQGPDAIEDTGYEPWIDPMGLQPDEWGERVIFSLQVAIGAAILAYYIGYVRAKNN